jgi:hypothetical protein
MSRAPIEPAGQFAAFRDFYPFYLSEHRHPVSRWLHFLGTSTAICCSDV